MLRRVICSKKELVALAGSVQDRMHKNDFEKRLEEDGLL